MLELIRRHPFGLILSLLGHVAIAAFLFFGLEQQYSDPSEQGGDVEPVQAVLVNTPEVEQEIESLRAQVDDTLASLPLESVEPVVPDVQQQQEQQQEQQRLQEELRVAEQLRQKQAQEQQALELKLKEEEQKRLQEEESD